MKIALVDNLPEGGAKRAVFEQVKGLSEHFEVDYYTNELESSYPFGNFATSINRFRLDLPQQSGLRRIQHEAGLFYSLLPNYKKMAMQINQSGASMAIVHPCKIAQSPSLIPYLNNPSLYFIEEWLRVYYEPELHSLKSLPFLNRNYEMARRQILAWIDYHNVQKATRLVTTSHFNQQHVKQTYNRHADIIPLGVDTEVFKPSVKSSRTHYLFVGNKEEIDGYDLLVEACNLTQNKPKIRFVGCDGVHFDANDQMMATYYQESVATICLARNEPFGLAPIESMACGTPVIAVNEGGYKDTVTDKETGFLISRDPEVLIRTMLSLSTDPSRYKLFSKAARKRVLDHFTWKQHVEKLKKVIDKMIYG